MLLMIPRPSGGAVVIARVQHAHAVAWSVVVPKGLDADVMIPTTIRGLTDAVDAALPLR
jgi:hypothetical protein